MEWLKICGSQPLILLSHDELNIMSVLGYYFLLSLAKNTIAWCIPSGILFLVDARKSLNF